MTGEVEKNLYSGNPKLNKQAIKAYTSMIKLLVETWKTADDKDLKNCVEWHIDDALHMINDILSEDVYNTIMTVYDDDFQKMIWYH